MLSRTTLYSPTSLTVELRDLVKNGVDIWDFEYDGYYEGEDKTAFERKVIDHYYFRQIGQETVERFKHFFRCRIQEIMPYYKQLYKSIKIMDAIEDPFGNVDITETFEQTTSSETESSSSNSQTAISEGTDTNSNTRRFSAAPRGDISNIDDYLTEATVENANSDSIAETTGSGEAEGSSITEGTTRHTFTKKGNQGVNTYAHDMIEYRQTILNIDKMVIDDLNDLFLGVY